MRRGAFIGILAGLSVLVYGQTLRHPIIWDDATMLSDNPALASLAFIPDYFHNPLTFSRDPKGAMYRPLLQVTFALDLATWGEARQSVGYHLTNISLHALVAALVFLLGLRLGLSRPMAQAAALLFVVHPLGTEPINHLTSRSVILAAAFYVAAVYAALSPSTLRRLAGVSLFSLCAMLTKEHTVTLPGTILLLTALPRRAHAISAASTRRPSTRALVLAACVSAVVAGAYIAVRFAVFPGEPFGKDFVRPIVDNIMTQTVVLWVYLGKVLWPLHLSVRMPFAEVTSLTDNRFLMAALGLLAVGGACAFLIRAGGRYGAIAGLGLAWFGAVLIPEAVIPLTRIINDHRVYLPMVGGALVLGLGWEFLARRAGAGARAALLGLLLVLTAITVQRNFAWATEPALWYRELALHPRLVSPRVFLGNMAMQRGDDRRAALYYRGAVALAPESATLQTRLSDALFNVGAYQESLAHARTAVALDPSNPATHAAVGSIALHLNHFAAAERAFRQAVALEPQSVALLTNLGVTRARQGAFDDALRFYDRALAIAPHPETWACKGDVLSAMEQDEDARAAYLAALQLNPTYDHALSGLALLDAR